MKSPIQLLPEFTDDDVDSVVKALGLFCDSERRAVLQHRESVDIRACAGSGKTTLLVAKLALLISRWEHRHRGIAILSHTNVAHEEIRRRFTTMPKLRALESYPFFLGTIQSFIATTLGVPGALKLVGARPTSIDNDLSGARAASEIASGSYPTAAAWLGNRANGNELVFGLRVECDVNGKLSLGSANGKLPAPDSKTTKELGSLKRRVVKSGVFRHDDIVAIARSYAIRYQGIRLVVARRFPVVFVDETQDTSRNQADLLKLLFNELSVVQRFGDDRQAIFSDADDQPDHYCFPNHAYLSISKSFRLSQAVAKVAENVTLGIAEPLHGDETRRNHQPTAFLFRPDRTRDVLPAFAQLVATELGVGRPSTMVMALGARASRPGIAADGPVSIGDYAEWRPKLNRPAVATYDTLTEYVEAAIRDVRLGQTLAGARTRLLNAAARILYLQDIRGNDKVLTGPQLVARLREIDSRYTPRLLKCLSRAIKTIAQDNTIEVTEFGTSLLSSLEPLLSSAWTERVIEFCTHQSAGLTSEPGSDQQGTLGDDKYRLAVDGGLVEVGLGTIHSVKGMTLDAVLVLTTSHFGDRDLPVLVDAGLFSGKRPKSKKETQVRFAANVKRIHVAVTRPTRLLCLAIPERDVDSTQRKELEQAGWLLKSV